MTGRSGFSHVTGKGPIGLQSGEGQGAETTDTLRQHLAT